MARTQEHILREMLGSQAIQLAALVAENEALKEQIEALKKPIEAPK